MQTINSCVDLAFLTNTANWNFYCMSSLDHLSLFKNVYQYTSKCLKPKDISTRSYSHTQSDTLQILHHSSDSVILSHRTHQLSLSRRRNLVARARGVEDPEPMLNMPCPVVWLPNTGVVPAPGTHEYHLRSKLRLNTKLHGATSEILDIGKTCACNERNGKQMKLHRKKENVHNEYT